MNIQTQPRPRTPVEIVVGVTAAYVHDDAEWHEVPLARVAHWYWLRWLRAKGDA